MENKDRKKTTPTELEDSQLDRVSGGAFTVNIHTHTCDNYVCVWCRCKKSSPEEKSHICEPNSGYGDGGQWLETAIANTCYECEHLYSCSKINT